MRPPRGPGSARIRAAAVTAAVVIGVIGLYVAPAPADDDPRGLAQIITLSNNDGSPTNCQLGRVDLGPAGTVTPRGPVFDIATDGCPFDMAWREDRLFGVLSFGDMTTASSLVTIDPTSGARTTIGSLGFATSLAGLAFDRSGTLWLYAQSADPSCAGGTGQACLYRLNTATGGATLVAVAASGDQVLGATASCRTVLADQFKQPGDQPPSGRLATVDTTTATLNPAPAPYGAGVLMTGIERDDHGAFYGLGFLVGENGPGPPSTFSIDATTGVATKIADPAVGPGQVLAALSISELRCDEHDDDPPPPVASTPVPITAPISFTG